jgi:hypothetical protein
MARIIDKTIPLLFIIHKQLIMEPFNKKCMVFLKRIITSKLLPECGVVRLVDFGVSVQLFVLVVGVLELFETLLRAEDLLTQPLQDLV